MPCLFTAASLMRRGMAGPEWVLNKQFLKKKKKMDESVKNKKGDVGIRGDY